MGSIDQIDAYSEGASVFLFGHGRLVEEIASAGGNLVMEDARHLGEVMVNTHINDAETESVLTAEHVHTSPTLGEVDHLLPCHFAWRNTNPFPFDAMVTTKKEVARMSERGS
jgi:hypothetical protein